MNIKEKGHSDVYTENDEWPQGEARRREREMKSKIPKIMVMILFLITSMFGVIAYEGQADAAAKCAYIADLDEDYKYLLEPYCTVDDMTGKPDLSSLIVYGYDMIFIAPDATQFSTGNPNHINNTNRVQTYGKSVFAMGAGGMDFFQRAGIGSSFVSESVKRVDPVGYPTNVHVVFKGPFPLYDPPIDLYYISMIPLWILSTPQSPYISLPIGKAPGRALYPIQLVYKYMHWAFSGHSEELTDDGKALVKNILIF